MASTSNSSPSTSIFMDADQWPFVFDSLEPSPSSESSSSFGAFKGSGTYWDKHGFTVLGHDSNPTAKSGTFQHGFGYSNPQLYSPHGVPWEVWNQPSGWGPPAGLHGGVILQPLYAGGGYRRPPPSGFVPFMPRHVQAFGNPRAYPVVFRPCFAAPPPDFRPVAAASRPPATHPPEDMQLLRAKLVSQIEYYFSKNNLVKDIFLRRNMDEEGWIPIRLIAGFKRVKKLTGDIGLVVEAMRSSSVVEVAGEKVRKRGDWSIWIMRLPKLPTESVTGVSSPMKVEGFEKSHSTIQAC